MVNERGSIWLALILLVLLGIAAGAGIYFAQNPQTQALATVEFSPIPQTLKSATPSPSSLPTPNPTPQLTLSGPTTKTYTNQTFALSVTYPSYGLISNTKTNQLEVGRCGDEILDNSSNSNPSIKIDGLLLIQVTNWTQDLPAYLSSQGISDTDALTSVPISGADEAVKLGNSDSSNSVEYVVKKGDQIFSLSESLSNPKGCINSKLIKAWGVNTENFSILPSDYLNWNLTDNFKFL